MHHHTIKSLLMRSHSTKRALTSLIQFTSRASSQFSGNNDKLEMSYIFGPSSVPLMGMTVGQLLQKGAEKYGDATAVVSVHQSVRKSFKQLLEEADQVAAGFLSLGLQRGDRIGIWGPNSYEWLLTQWAAARAGLVLVNINPAYRLNELRHALNLVGPRALVVAEKFRNQSLVDIVSELQVPASAGSTAGSADNELLFSSAAAPSLERVIVLSDQRPNNLRGAILWKDVTDRATDSLIKRVRSLQRKVQFDEPANIQFTSGTTGSPKGATLSHHNITNNAYLTGLRMGYHKTEHRFCVPVPLYHSFGCAAVLHSGIFGATLVFPSPTYSGRETVNAIHHEKCTNMYATPTMYVDMLHLPDLKNYDLTSLKQTIMGGAPCPIEITRRIVNELKVDLRLAFGMTETSPCSFLTLSEDNFERRCSTVGRPLDHQEVKIVDPQTHEVVPVNTPGEVWTRGPSTMLGYWNDAKSTADTITKERWLRTGDMAVLDESGYLQIVGRIKEMIIRGGENIYPREIEEVLHTHPKVQDVQIVGVPDPRLGEEVCAWVRPKSGAELIADDLKQFCKERLAYFKVPRYWMFKEQFPLTVTGKVQKFVMRQASIEELRLASSVP